MDSLDADGYVAVFTEDAVIDSNGSISKGHEEIRKIVTDLIKRADDNKAAGKPAGNLHPVISNVRIVGHRRRCGSVPSILVAPII